MGNLILKVLAGLLLLVGAIELVAALVVFIQSETGYAFDDGARSARRVGRMMALGLLNGGGIIAGLGGVLWSLTNRKP